MISGTVLFLCSSPRGLVMISGISGVPFGLVLMSFSSFSISFFFGVDLNLGSGEGSGLDLGFSMMRRLVKAVMPAVVRGLGLPWRTVSFSASLS